MGEEDEQLVSPAETIAPKPTAEAGATQQTVGQQALRRELDTRTDLAEIKKLRGDLAVAAVEERAREMIKSEGLIAGPPDTVPHDIRPPIDVEVLAQRIAEQSMAVKRQEDEQKAQLERCLGAVDEVAQPYYDVLTAHARKILADHEHNKEEGITLGPLLYKIKEKRAKDGRRTYVATWKDDPQHNAEPAKYTLEFTTRDSGVEGVEAVKRFEYNKTQIRALVIPPFIYIPTGHTGTKVDVNFSDDGGVYKLKAFNTPGVYMPKEKVEYSREGDGGTPQAKMGWDKAFVNEPEKVALFVAKGLGFIPKAAPAPAPQ
jgi:hypothetical protein